MAVCSGYARLFEKMCSIAGIRCKTITGTFERHTWNAVYIDGKWHLLDCTFGSGFVDDGKFTFRYDELYFLTHPDLFEQDHTPDCFILKIFVKLGLHILEWVEWIWKGISECYQNIVEPIYKKIASWFSCKTSLQELSSFFL
ncbi:kyphoscoliosis peptidase-like isoform X1 [Anolis carolinensis]|uniref:kyphoscoliosis peptidase-like isoform X1 n=1 Tax=Anolis carolinensis TaxID=28377 RepID=UPI002F2B1611